jgi:hypothetical protein
MMTDPSNTRGVAAIVLGIALAACASVTGWGLAHNWPTTFDLYWSDGSSLARYGGFLGICSIVVMAGSYWSRRSALLVGGILALVFTALSGNLWSLLVVSWFAGSSVLLGRSVLAALANPLEGEWPTELLVGAGIYGTAAGLCAHAPVNYPGLYAMALALPVVLHRKEIAAAGSRLFSRTLPSSAAFALEPLDVAIAAVGLVHFVVALMPEIGYDALTMHLFAIGHLSARHRWAFDGTAYVWAVMPMLGDWVFSFAHVLAGETATRLLNVGFILVLCRLVCDLVRWAGGGARGARWAVLIFLSTPLVFTVSSSLFIESVWASFVVAGVFAALKAGSDGGQNKGWLVSAGVLLGCAIAAKSGTFMLLPVPLFILALGYRSWRTSVSLTSATTAMASLLMIGCIPYLTAWWLTGNPVFPFFNGYFQSPFYPSTNFADDRWGQGIKWDTAYLATFRSGSYLEASPGVPGFQWLLLLVPALVILIAESRRKGIALMLSAVAVVVLVFQAVSYLRYAFPAWALLAAPIGLALGETSSAWGLRHVARAVAIATVALNLFLINAGSPYRDFPLAVIADQQERDRYVLDRLPIRHAVKLVNDINTSQTPIAVFAEPQVAGLHADAVYPSWYNYGFYREVRGAKTETGMAEVLSKRGIEYLILDSRWNGAPGMLGLISNVTTPVATFRSLTVRKSRTDIKYRTELLLNHDFASVTGWTLSGKATYDATKRILTASAASPAAQVVAVTPGGHYFSSVVARCANEVTMGRIQINWIGAKDELISTSFELFECTSTWSEYTMESVAPASATRAVVYATSHSEVPLEFQRNSLRY